MIKKTSIRSPSIALHLIRTFTERRLSLTDFPNIVIKPPIPVWPFYGLQELFSFSTSLKPLLEPHLQ